MPQINQLSSLGGYKKTQRKAALRLFFQFENKKEA
jgi:hypothetical protein